VLKDIKIFLSLGKSGTQLTDVEESVKEDPGFSHNESVYEEDPMESMGIGANIVMAFIALGKQIFCINKIVL